MPGPKTNEIPGTRAVLRHSRMSAYKVREVLDIIRGKEVGLAAEILRFSERDAAHEVGKLLASAVANAENNDQMDPEELYVSTCYADEGGTIKRWRPRARGRASRIRKRTCHVTVIVSRLPEDRLQRVRARQAADLATRRARRVAGQRQSQRPEADQELEELAAEAVEAAQIEAEEGMADEQAAAVAAVESATPEEFSALPPSAEESSTEPGGASSVESTEEGE
ncbi:MAG: 50S ribosomal protein L22 [Acidimicrobiales bacterium]